MDFFYIQAGIFCAWDTYDTVPHVQQKMITDTDFASWWCCGRYMHAVIWSLMWRVFYVGIGTYGTIGYVTGQIHSNHCTNTIKWMQWLGVWQCKSLLLLSSIDALFNKSNLIFYFLELKPFGKSNLGHYSILLLSNWCKMGLMDQINDPCTSSTSAICPLTPANCCVWMVCVLGCPRMR